MKYLVVLIVVVVGVWMLVSRFRKPGDTREAPSAAGDGGAPGQADAPRADTSPRAQPRQIVACRHCGVHLPADEAVLEGSQPYCTPSHRQAGPR